MSLLNRFDFLVIGSGPAGQRAAIQAAKLGKKTAIIERRSAIGGVSVHTGTIPSKTLRQAVLYLTGWDQRGLYGEGYRLKTDLTIDDLMRRIQVTLAHEVEVMRHQVSRNGVTVIEGAASFIDPNTLRVENARGEVTEISGDKILIATGTRPIRADNIPFDDETIIDSDGVLNLKAIPRSMTIIGAGVIGAEYASIFNALDIKVTLVDGRASLLDFLDRELVDEFVHHLRSHGTILRLNEKVSHVERNGRNQVVTFLESGKIICSDMVLVAAGRIGCTYGLALQNAGLVADEKRRLKVNDTFQTDVPHIYAAGDVIGFPSLASTSMEQGRMAACHAFGNTTNAKPGHFPFGVYAVPEISMVGLTEQELTAQKIPYEAGIARLRETARGQILGLNAGVLKILFSTTDRRVLGVHILGEGATELIHIGQAALILGGTLNYFLENVFNYPTLAEAYKIAALDAWNRLSSHT